MEGHDRLPPEMKRHIERKGLDLLVLFFLITLLPFFLLLSLFLVVVFVVVVVLPLTSFSISPFFFSFFFSFTRPSLLHHLVLGLLLYPFSSSCSFLLPSLRLVFLFSYCSSAAAVILFFFFTSFYCSCTSVPLFLFFSPLLFPRPTHLHLLDHILLQSSSFCFSPIYSSSIMFFRHIFSLHITVTPLSALFVATCLLFSFLLNVVISYFLYALFSLF